MQLCELNLHFIMARKTQSFRRRAANFVISRPHQNRHGIMNRTGDGRPAPNDPQGSCRKPPPPPRRPSVAGSRRFSPMSVPASGVRSITGRRWWRVASTARVPTRRCVGAPLTAAASEASPCLRVSCPALGSVGSVWSGGDQSALARRPAPAAPAPGPRARIDRARSTPEMVQGRTPPPPPAHRGHCRLR